MANCAQISCINKPDRDSSVDRIQNIGGFNFDRSRWKISVTKAIDMIENEGWSFYVSVGSDTVFVEVAKSAAGNKYLKTRPDHTRRDNLLSLPECPA